MSNNQTVSVIIPTRNSSRTIEACITSVQNQSYDDIEIIVVDNASKDNTAQISKSLADICIDAGPERSAQRNIGAKHASGQFFLFIDSDMVLESEVVADAVKVIRSSDVKAVVIPEISFGSGLWASVKAFERRSYIGISWMEAARFFTKEVFETYSGYDESNTGTEDYDLPNRIVAAEGESILGRTNSLIHHDEGALSLTDTLQKKYYYGKKIAAYFNKNENVDTFRKQRSILSRFSLFFSNIDSVQDLLHFIVLIFLKTLEMIAIYLGYLSNMFSTLSSSTKN